VKKSLAIKLKLLYIYIMTMTQKTFSSLDFNDHGNNPNAVQARLNLTDSLEISVVSMKEKEAQFGSVYGNLLAGTYEVAVFNNNNMIPLTPFDDVRGWQTEDDINELLNNLQGDFSAQFIANLYITRDEERADLGLTNHS
jgi:hypothetical protein|tara:strand:+ start:923 stop:1342 length:420 start_codon:yes stop_codon:yes gene_type:complete